MPGSFLNQVKTKTLITKHNFKFIDLCFIALNTSGHINEHVNFCYFQRFFKGEMWLEENTVLWIHEFSPFAKMLVCGSNSQAPVPQLVLWKRSYFGTSDGEIQLCTHFYFSRKTVVLSWSNISQIFFFLVSIYLYLKLYGRPQELLILGLELWTFSVWKMETASFFKCLFTHTFEENRECTAC